MKQFSPITTITSLLDSLDSDGGLRISGFHPDFFLPLINAIDRDLFITVPNNCFTSASKYLSSLWDNNSVVFISPSSVDNNVPVGFSASENHLAVRAKELLAEGLESIKIIFSSHDGISLPILSCGIENRLAFTLGVSFEDCYDFLVLENYVSAEFVTTPGEFATRGGIIDVFPFSSFCPYRINFFDDRPTIFRFNVDSQLTTETIDNFILSSISKNEHFFITSILPMTASLEFNPSLIMPISRDGLTLLFLPTLIKKLENVDLRRSFWLTRSRRGLLFLPRGLSDTLTSFAFL